MSGAEGFLRLSTLPRSRTSSPSPAARKRGRGEGCPHLPPQPPSAPTLWARKGEMLPDELRHSASSFVYFSHATDEEGGMSGAEGFLRLATLPRSRTSSPLSPSAGEGPRVRAAPAHNGCAGTGRTQRDIWVFDQALRTDPNHRLTVERMKAVNGCTGAALLRPDRAAATTGEVA